MKSLLAPLVLSFALPFATIAAAQDDFIAQILMDTECVGGGTATVMLTADVNIVTALPADAIGWVIERSVLGYCWPVADVGEVRPFPAARETFVLYDEPPLAGYNTIYQAYAVMASGDREPILQAYRTHFAQADCAGGPAARGVIVELGPGYYHLDVCPDECWWELSYFDGDLPAEAPELVGQTLNLYGTLEGGMEGPFLNMTDWEISPVPCFVVPTDETDWSGLKARFR